MDNFFECVTIEILLKNKKKYPCEFCWYTMWFRFFLRDWIKEPYQRLLKALCFKVTKRKLNFHLSTQSFHKHIFTLEVRLLLTSGSKLAALHDARHWYYLIFSSLKRIHDNGNSFFLIRLHSFNTPSLFKFYFFFLSVVMKTRS